MLTAYSIFVDLSRDLEEYERKDIFTAIYEIVPGGASAGRYETGNHDEVYFVLDASSEEIAYKKADEYMKWILQKSKIEVDYTIEISINPKTYGKN